MPNLSNVVTFAPRANGGWVCCGSPSSILQAISLGCAPVSKGVKTYYKGLAKLGVERGWFSYHFIPDETLDAKLQECLGSKREIHGDINEIFNSFGDQEGHA